MILPLAPKDRECAPKISRRLRQKACREQASSNPGMGQICSQTENVDKTLLKRTTTSSNVVSERVRSGSNLSGSCSNPTCSHISDGAGVNLKSSTTLKNAGDQGLGIRVPELRPSESRTEVACLTGRDLAMGEGCFTSSNVEQIGLYDKISKRFEDLCNGMNKKLEAVLNTFTRYDSMSELKNQHPLNIEKLKIPEDILRLVDHGDKTRIKNTSLVHVTEFGDQVKFDNQTSKCKKDSALIEAAVESDEESDPSEADPQVLKNEGEFNANESHCSNCVYNSCLPVYMAKSQIRPEVTIDSPQVIEIEEDQVGQDIDYKDAYASILNKGVLGNWNTLGNPEPDVEWVDAKALPNDEKWCGHDLTNEKVLEHLASKIHHNIGNYDWKVMSQHLRTARVPKRFYEGMKKHIKNCERMKIPGRGPLSRPAAFPSATAPFEILKIDFVYWKTHKIIHFMDSFSRFSVLKYFGDKNSEKGEPTEKAIKSFMANWMAYFGTPRILFTDPDPIFTSGEFKQMSEGFNISLITTPPDHHQSFGAIERKHITTKQNLNDICDKNADLSLTEIIAIAQMVQNCQISQIDGATPGHRIFGRAPRLPIPSAESATCLDMLNMNEAPETKTQKVIATIISAREIWLKNDTNAKLRTAMYRAPRRTPTNELFIGQTVYFWQPVQLKLQKSQQKWQGPGIIIGVWGHQALVAYQSTFFKVANENLITTDKMLEAIGSDEQLQLHSSGGKVSISEVCDAQTLTFLHKYKNLLETGARGLTIQQLQNLTLEPITKNRLSQSERTTGSLGGEGDAFVELERRLQSMTEEELRSINKEGREKLRQALTELRRRREKKKKKTDTKKSE